MPSLHSHQGSAQRAETLARFVALSQRNLDAIVDVALEDGDSESLGETLIHTLTSILITTQGDPTSLLTSPPGQRQIGAIRVLMSDSATAERLFSDLEAGMGFNNFRSSVQSVYTQAAAATQTFSIAIMEVAARVVYMAYQDAIPPPVYHDGLPSPTRDSEFLVEKMNDGIRTTLRPAEHPPPRPNATNTTEGATSLVRRRAIPGQSPIYQSPTQSPHGPSPIRSSRQTPSSARSGQRTPATPLTQNFTPADVDTTPSNRRLPPVPSLTTPVSPTSSSGPPLPLTMTASFQSITQVPPSANQVPPPSANQIAQAPASTNQATQTPATLISSQVDDIVHALPHPGPCRYPSEPIIIRHTNRCELCPTVTGQPGRPCVEEQVEVLVRTQVRPSPYPQGHPSAGSTLVYQLTLAILAEILVNIVRERLNLG